MSPPSDPYSGQQMGPPRWSALAITAFVFSLVGFLGFTAILGIILGIAGIVVTRGGRRRGVGLAIAAIPISLITGAVGAFIVVGIVSFVRMGEMTKQVETVLSGSEDSNKAIDSIYEHSTPTFQQEVSRETLSSWLGEVRRKHGNLINLDRTIKTGTVTSAGNRASFNLPGKFVNGTALVRLLFVQRGLIQPLIDDLDVDGYSPRKPSKVETPDS
jgi:hypothetical protein